ncbi:hypothetical protein H6F47_25070 [Sphaerospermopsis sp. FACHB-1094]|uniref:hypothetical protein n=1 Tax=Sphaerospermopsis sp. FACHB-1094 TaxID=2692861 RepID=UPI001683AEAC|nr:hypothetical protein [Sphaerospermopsis sp. FACHB-1094]MBD2135597.1 hypothetical protein [Sphaerospermopsis sp. FACHB-1094]
MTTSIFYTHPLAQTQEQQQQANSQKTYICHQSPVTSHLFTQVRKNLLYSGMY